MSSNSTCVLYSCLRFSDFLHPLKSLVFCSCSNASDALDKLRFLAVTQPDLLKDSVDLDIRIQTDKDNGIITLT